MQPRGDRLWLGARIGGFLILAATFFLRWRSGLADVPYSIGLVLGAGMIAPQFILNMIARWRTGSGGPPSLPGA